MIENPSVEIVPPTVGNVKLQNHMLDPLLILPAIVTFVGNPIVTVLPVAAVSISPDVPAIVKVCI